MFEPARDYATGRGPVSIAVSDLNGDGKPDLATANATATAVAHTPSPMRFLSEVLGRPRNEKAFAVVPVGYPAEDAVVPDLVRKSLDQVLVRV